MTQCIAIVNRYGPWPKGAWEGRCYYQAVTTRQGLPVCKIHAQAKTLHADDSARPA